jgi:PD-(D/E)XK nuclease superfamily protein
MALLHVTDIIRLNGLTDDEFVSQFAMDRGTAVHDACALWIRKDLDPASVDPVHVAPRLASFQRYVRESGCRIVESERKVQLEAMGYEGRLDLVLELPSLGLVVVDIKNGGPVAWHAWQTAGYAMAYAAELKIPTPLRAGLYLDAEGGAPRFLMHRDRRDFPRWTALVTVAHLKVELGEAA